MQFNKAFLFAGTACFLTYVGLFQIIWFVLTMLNADIAQINLGNAGLLIHFFLTSVSCVTCYKLLRQKTEPASVYSPIIKSVLMISLMHSSILVMLVAASAISMMLLLTLMLFNSLSLCVVLAICARVYERVAQS